MLFADGGKLRYWRLTPELRAAPCAHKPDILAALAHADLSGISPEFAARLCAEDLNDIASGDIAGDYPGVRTGRHRQGGRGPT